MARVPRKLAAAVAIAYGILFAALKAKQRNKKSDLTATKDIKKTESNVVRKPGAFWRLLAILLGAPGRSYLAHPEVRLIGIHSVLLVARTWASVFFAVLEGRIVSALTQRDAKKFFQRVLLLGLAGIPVGTLNALIKFCQDELALRFRTTLTAHVRRIYMSDNVFYKAENLDSRVNNADQLIVSDIEKFASHLAELWSSLAKPSLDLLFFNGQLAANIGFEGFLFCTALVHLGTFSMRLAAPAFGRLVKEQQELEGLYRAACSRVITHGEEIAFYGGARAEEGILARAYNVLADHTHRMHRATLPYTSLEHFVTKYYWSAVGFLFTAVPVFGQTGAQSAHSVSAYASGGVSAGASAVTSSFVTNKRLLVSISDAFGRFLSSVQQLSRLQGHAQRIDDMLVAFEAVRLGQYTRAADGATQGEAQHTPIEFHGRLELVPGLDHVSVQDVVLTTPSGDILVGGEGRPGLTFDVRPGEHVFVSGPNGCGKSSLFRVLAGLWPIAEGVIRKPENANIFYIPQRPYLVSGTLRDQITYPHTKADLHAAGRTDEDVLAALKVVDLISVVERSEKKGGLDAVEEWADRLSGGEKQRVAMARVLYHKPEFAVLDECTSAVSSDIEDAIYAAFKEQGATLFTISHRKSLWKHHSHLLAYDGRGNFEFRPMTAADFEQ